MSQELLVNITPMETRVALVENGVPQEIFVERNNKRGLVGNIYKGKVVRVLPGMQAAFVDIGEARTAFLHIDDLLPRKIKLNSTDNGEPDIRKLLHDGQQIAVQVIKDPVGSKGARLSAQLSSLSPIGGGTQNITTSERIFRALFGGNFSDNIAEHKL